MLWLLLSKMTLNYGVLNCGFKFLRLRLHLRCPTALTHAHAVVVFNLENKLCHFNGSVRNDVKLQTTLVFSGPFWFFSSGYFVFLLGMAKPFSLGALTNHVDFNRAVTLVCFAMKMCFGIMDLQNPSFEAWVGVKPWIRSAPTLASPGHTRPKQFHVSFVKCHIFIIILSWHVVEIIHSHSPLSAPFVGKVGGR